MNDNVQFVDYQESISIKVGRFLISKGFGPALGSGLALNSLVAADSLCILYEDADAKPRKYLFGLIKRKQRRMYLGTIWFSNDARSASKQNWVFDMYGRKYVELVRQLTEEMARTFNVKITLRLIAEEPGVEKYMSDYDY